MHKSLFFFGENLIRKSKNVESSVEKKQSTAAVNLSLMIGSHRSSCYHTQASPLVATTGAGACTSAGATTGSSAATPLVL
jgi:hypothetical protein